MVHDVKILSKYFERVLDGSKTFEYRFNDRDYKVGDKIILNEITEDIEYTGRKLKFTLGFILYLEDGFAILSLKNREEC